MTTGRGEAPEPFFLNGRSGRLFAIHHPPRGAGAGAVLYLHPFAEEMNRSRRMAALQARRLAAAGCGVLLLDLFGCGDSAGDFAEATWRRWTDDVAAAIDWLAPRSDGPIGLWGVRIGAMLAVQAARSLPDRVARIVLWQPVASGATMLAQFMRVRVAASAMGGGDRESTRSLRDRLAAGETIEVAGYGLSPALAGELDGLELARLAPPAGIPVDWIELVSRPDAPVPPGSRRVIDGWRAEGCDVAVHGVAGEPFWTIQEITVAPALLDRTTRLFAEGGR